MIPEAFFTSRMRMPGIKIPKPSPVVPELHAVSLKAVSFQVEPSAPFAGTIYFTAALPATSVVELNCKPKLSFGCCDGNSGEKCACTVPSGRTSARYSPPAASEKFVCSGRPTVTRFFPDAQTMRNPPGSNVTAGKRHFVSCEALSVSAH